MYSQSNPTDAGCAPQAKQALGVSVLDPALPRTLCLVGTALPVPVYSHIIHISPIQAEARRDAAPRSLTH
jgi:hypothetical protein